MSLISILEDIRKIKSGRKELCQFGITIGAVLSALGGLLLWRGKASYPYFFAFGLLFMGFGAIAPLPLKPLQKAWMAVSVIIGYFMSRAVLTVLFYGILTPIGSLLRIFGKDILDRRISKARPSYWWERPAEGNTKESYENQY
ncbi:MAG: SxtJ family membrane protein [Candidatus Omnitrophica bacterium]|nr:SxtJ family membrane protein [Candidatus Omnitrophota bacterium]